MRGKLILVVVVASLGGQLFGFDIAIITGAVPFIKEYFALNDLQLGWGVSSLLVGCVVGSLITGRVTDIYGRKKILFIVSLVFAATCVATGLATDFTLFVVARLLGGVAVGAASVVSPMYISEVAPSKIRGRLISFYQLSIVLGIVISYFVNYILKDMGDDNWRWMFISGIVPSVTFFFCLFFVPETPRFLFLKNRKEEALNVLVMVGGKENADKELQQIAESFKNHTEKVSFSQLFAPEMHKVMIVGFGLAIFVQFCGINSIIDYAPIILETAGWDIDAALFGTFVIGAVNLFFTLFSLWLIEVAGRRMLYLVGSLGLTIILGIIATLAYFNQFQGNIALGLIMAYIALFASCIGPVFWTLVAEIFPNRVRGTAMSVPVFTQWIANAFVVMFFPWLLSNVGPMGSFGLFSISSFLMFLFTYFYVPETKGKTLEEIEKLWE